MFAYLGKYVVSLLWKYKREYYNYLDIKKNIDNKKVWETVKPLFSDKLTSNNKITLIENWTIFSEEDNIADTLNNCFSDIITNLIIPKYEDSTTQRENIDDLILKAIEKYKHHPTIQAITMKAPFGNFSISLFIVYYMLF